MDNSILAANLNKAADIYIERVNQCPCGDTKIHLMKGASSVEYQEKRRKLQIFLKGSNIKKEELRRDELDLFDYFSRVWSVCCNHVCQKVPMQYVFLLMCCYKPDCYHPLCQQQTHPKHPKWFSDGPDVENVRLLLPVLDPSRPFAGTDCKLCKGRCSGHFLPAEQRLSSQDEPMMPPSSTIKKFLSLKRKGSEPTEDQIEMVARKTLLPTEDVAMWLKHLKTVQENRERGAKKAAATRRGKNRKEVAAEGQEMEEEGTRKRLNITVVFAVGSFRK